MVHLSIQGSYSALQLALFENESCLGMSTFDHKKASSHLLLLINDLLSQFGYTRNELSFIGVDKGPGAFTSLRVIISTVNGIAFASHIPLIGIDGLEALGQEIINNENIPPAYLVIMLNAYGGDAYYRISSNAGLLEKGCEKGQDLIQRIASSNHEGMLLFAGNGVGTYASQIGQFFGNRAQLKNCSYQISSAKTIGQLAYKAWIMGDQSTLRIVPHYIKTQYFAIPK